MCVLDNLSFIRLYLAKWTPIGAKTSEKCICIALRLKFVPLKATDILVELYWCNHILLLAGCRNITLANGVFVNYKTLTSEIIFRDFLLKKKHFMCFCLIQKQTRMKIQKCFCLIQKHTKMKIQNPGGTPWGQEVQKFWTLCL